MSAEQALRKQADEAQAKVDRLRADYAKGQSKQVGRQLLKAREKASEALEALYAVCPEERPPTQQVM